MLRGAWLVAILICAGCAATRPARSSWLRRDLEPPIPEPARLPDGSPDVSCYEGLLGRYEAYGVSSWGGEVLELFPNGAARLTQIGCCGSWSEYASATLGDGTLKLSTGDSDECTNATEFVPVAWGADLLLAFDLPEFMNALHDGARPGVFELDSSAYIRRSPDSGQLRRGTPRLPAPWNARLRTEPLLCNVVETASVQACGGRGADSVGEAWRIDRGLADGVFDGMQLWAQDYHGPHSHRVVVVHAFEHDAIVAPRSPGVLASGTVLRSGAFRPR